MPTTAMEVSNNNSVRLQSCDGRIFEVETEVASTSGIIKRAMGDLGSNITIPLPTVSAKILRLVIKYCRYHVLDAPKASPKFVTKWDNEFVKDLVDDRATLFELCKAANYLVIKNLLDFTCQTIADMMKGKTTEQMRELFTIYDED